MPICQRATARVSTQPYPAPAPTMTTKFARYATCHCRGGGWVGLGGDPCGRPRIFCAIFIHTIFNSILFCQRLCTASLARRPPADNAAEDHQQAAEPDERDEWIDKYANSRL